MEAGLAGCWPMARPPHPGLVCLVCPLCEGAPLLLVSCPLELVPCPFMVPCCMLPRQRRPASCLVVFDHGPLVATCRDLYVQCFVKAFNFTDTSPTRSPLLFLVLISPRSTYPMTILAPPPPPLFIPPYPHLSI